MTKPSSLPRRCKTPKRRSRRQQLYFDFMVESPNHTCTTVGDAAFDNWLRFSPPPSPNAYIELCNQERLQQIAANDKFHETVLDVHMLRNDCLLSSLQLDQMIAQFELEAM